MKRLHYFLFGVLIGCSAITVTAKLSGKVVDENGNPVADALLSLRKNPKTVNTATDGTFDFGDSIVSARVIMTSPVSKEPFFSSQSISFHVENDQTPVLIEVFTLSGKKIGTAYQNTLSSNTYTIAFAHCIKASAAYIVRAHIGNRVFTGEIVSGGNVSLVRNYSQRKSQDKNGFSATVSGSMPIDTIIATAEGYENAQHPISSYEDESVEITMQTTDTIPPTITMLGGDTVYVATGKYWDVNALEIEVTDNKTPEDSIIIIVPTQTSIDSSVSGFHLIEHKATDLAFNTARVNRLLVYVDSSVTDTEAPVITLVPDTVTLLQGENYLDTGVTVTDNIDEHINFNEWVKGTGSILKEEVGSDTYATGHLEPGTYTVTYEVIDTHQNRAIKERVVIITAQ